MSPHGLSVTTVTLGSRLFFYSAGNKLTYLLSVGELEVPDVKLIYIGSVN